MTSNIISLSGNAKDITGLVFGKLTAIAPVEKTKTKDIKWLCICECGTESAVLSRSLSSGHSMSCGCSQVNLMRDMGLARKTHGMTDTPEYKSWCKIKARCLNKNDCAYKDYGARGIKVCEEWINSFEAFYADMGSRPEHKAGIDRIDNNGDYTKANCRWATPKQQARNTRRNKMITYNGETKCVAEWAERIGINTRTLSDRLKYGWSVGRALTEPVHYRGQA